MRIRFLCVLVALFMLMPMPTAVADVSEYQEYYEHYNLLHNLGIVEDNMILDAEKVISRADAVTLFVRLRGLSGEVSGGDVPFTDVPSSGKLSGYLNLAISLGMVNGVGNRQFQPDNGIKLSEALKIAVVALGQNVIAENKGGYPSGYVAVASQSRLLVGLSKDLQANMTGGDLITLLYNTLLSDTYSSEFVNSDGVRLYKSGPILNLVFDCYKGTGIVTGNYLTALSNAADYTRQDFVRIGTVEYAVGSTNAPDLLGYSVNFFYLDREDYSYKELVNIELKQFENTLTSVDAKHISYSNGTFTYNTDKANSKDTKVNVNKLINVIYNNKSISEFYTTADLNPVTGMVKLIDNNSDNTIDVVIIENYKTIAVNAIDSIDKIVYDYAGDLSADLNDDYSHEVRIVKNNKFVNFSEIVLWNVVCVMESKYVSPAYVTAYIVDTNIKGSIEEMEQDDDGLTVKIGGKAYAVSRSFPTKKMSEMILGASGTFYFDINGAIAAADFKAAVSEYQFGYLVTVGNIKGLNDTVGIKIFTKNNEHVDYTLGDRTIIDSTTYKGIANAIAALKASAYELDANELKLPALQKNVKNSEYSQPVKYKVNEENIVYEIDTHMNSGYQGGLKMAHGYTTSMSHKYISEGRLFVNNSDENKDRFSIIASTLTIYVPIDRHDYEKYTIKDPSYFGSGMVYKTLEFYDKNEAGYCDYIIAYHENRTSGFGPDNAAMIFDSAKQVINPRTETQTHKLRIYRDGKLQDGALLADGCVLPTNLTEGDVIRYITNKHGEATEIRIALKVDNLPYINTRLTTAQQSVTSEREKIIAERLYMEASNSVTTVNIDTVDNYKSAYRSLFGIVLGKEGTNLSMVANFPDEDEWSGSTKQWYTPQVIGKNAQVYTYDPAAKTGKKVTFTNTNSIVPYNIGGDSASRVFLQSRYGDLRLIYIIK